VREDGEDEDVLQDARGVSRALRRRGVAMRCPACEWTLDGPLGDYLLVPVSSGTPDVRPAIKLAVYACRNCGYVRLHSSNVLRAALGDGDDTAAG
jgi:rubredoxin